MDEECGRRKGEGSYSDMPVELQEFLEIVEAIVRRMLAPESHRQTVDEEYDLPGPMTGEPEEDAF